MPERVDADVCVVGAGYAGLTAARRSSEGGKAVVVLEARDRVGGRIWTQHLSDGSPVDRGGARLGPEHDAIFGLAAEVGVSTYKTWVKGAHLLIHAGRSRRYTGLIPKISPLAVLTIALAQAKLDRMAKQVPVEAPWAAKRAEEWDSRSVAWWLDRSGIRTTIARDLFEMAVRGLFTADLHEVSFLHLLFLVRAHGSIGTLFSEGGSQENMVDGGAGSIAQRVADALGGAMRLNAPVRSITQREDHVLVETGDLVVSARHVVVTVPPALALEIAFDPVLPHDRLLLYRNAVAGPETKTLVVYDEPFWRADGFSGQTAEPGSAAEVTLDATPSSGRPGVIASFTFGARCRAVGGARQRRAAARGDRCAHGPVGSARRGTIRVHRDAVVEGGLDARLLDGASRPGHPHALRASAPGALRTGALGRNRDLHDVARRDGWRRAFRRTRRRRNPRCDVAPGDAHR
jgi:monoamine oxidase